MGAIQQIRSEEELAEFLGRRAFSVIHLDAQWDGCRGEVERKMAALAPGEGEWVSFGYIDVDVLGDYARGIGLLNVPACAYYRGREMVATVIGMNQDIAGNLMMLREGGTPVRGGESG